MVERKNFKAFKLNILYRYKKSGRALLDANGDSNTDFAAGVPQDKLFAITRQDDQRVSQDRGKHIPVVFRP